MWFEAWQRQASQDALYDLFRAELFLCPFSQSISFLILLTPCLTFESFKIVS